MDVDALVAARFTNRVDVQRLSADRIDTVDSLKCGKQCRAAAFSSDGTNLAVAGDDGLLLYDMDTKESRLLIEAPPVLSIHLSPSSKYIAVYHQFSAEQCVHNMKIVQISPEKEVFSATQRSPHNWYPKWATDESFACIYHNGVLKSILETDGKGSLSIALPALQAFALSPDRSSAHIAVFCRQTKDEPSSFSIYNKAGEPVNSLRMYDIDEGDLRWNFSGTALLVLCQNTKTTEKSYYGENKLVLLDLCGAKQTISFSPSKEDTGVSDFNWSPTADEFCVVYDRTRAALYNGKGERIKSLMSPHGARTGVIYDTSGEFIALTGSGNVKGNFEIWHRNPQIGSKSVKPLSGQIDVSYATMFRWASGRYLLLAATTFPRLRQENGFRVFNLVGQCLLSMKIPENNLVDLIWRPEKARKISEVELGRMVADLKDRKKQLDSSPASSPQKPSKYIPPHLRGKTNGEEKSPKQKRGLPPGLA